MSGPLSLEMDVIAAGEGDREAFARLVNQSANLVCSISLAIVRNFDASQDVAQEVFLAAWVQIKKLRNPSSFLPWIRQITRNTAHAYMRDEMKHRALSEADAILADTADPHASPDQQYLREEEHRLLAEALDELPAESREVLFLYYREGCSIQQVADLLGMRDDAVKQRLSRARARLREEMLERIGKTLRRTVPGAAFTTLVMASMAVGAAPASAATVAGFAKASSAGVMMKVLISAGGAIAGAAGGVWGVVHGLAKFQKVARDEQERHELKRFKRVAVFDVVLAAVAFVVCSQFRSWIAPVVVYFLFATSLYLLYFGWLPRITARRIAAELNEDPQAWRRHRKDRILSYVGFVAGTLTGGLGLILGLVMAGLL